MLQSTISATPTLSYITDAVSQTACRVATGTSCSKVLITASCGDINTWTVMTPQAFAEFGELAGTRAVNLKAQKDKPPFAFIDFKEESAAAAAIAGSVRSCSSASAVRSLFALIVLPFWGAPTGGCILLHDWLPGIAETAASEAPLIYGQGF